MPASFVQAIGSTNAAGGTAITSSALSIATGNYLIVHASHYTTGVNVSAVVQTSGANAFIKAGTTQGGDANQDNEIWYTPSPLVGTTSATFQVRFTGAAAFRIIQVSEFSWGGVTSISYGVESAHILKSGSVCSSLTLTPLTSDNLLIGAWVAFEDPHLLSSGSATLIGPAVGAGTDDFGLAYRLVDSVSAYTVSVIINNTSHVYSTVCKAFEGVGASSTATAADMHTLTLTNAGS